MGLGEKKIGIAGAGNMGSAILEGMLSRKIAAPAQVYLFDKVPAKAEALSAKLKVKTADSAPELVKACDILLLAVKPQDLVPLAGEINKCLDAKRMVISILAGTTLERLAELLGSQVHLVRAMPNLAALAGESFTALVGNSEEALVSAESVLGTCGRTARIEEKYFDWITALSGSGPAYFFLLMEIVSAKAREAGLPSDMAELLAVQTAMGAACVARTSPDPPSVLREKVTSKGGTTEAALQILAGAKVKDVFFKAFDAAASRSRDLRQA